MNTQHLQTLTSFKTSSELDSWAKTSCTHTPPYSLLCTGDCFEYKGMSSRLTEAHMKNMKIKLFYIPCPRDSADFIGYSEGIMADHPEWRARLGEMVKYGVGWERFVKYYEDCETEAKQKKHTSLYDIMKGFDKNECKLNYYQFDMSDTSNIPNTSVELKEYLIMGSVIPRNNLDEFDICTTCICDKLPKYGSLNDDGHLVKLVSNIYDSNGKKTGWLTINPIHPNELNKIDSNNQLNKLIQLEYNIVKQSDDVNKPYNDKMLELYKRYKSGEFVSDEEVPKWSDYLDAQNNLTNTLQTIQDNITKHTKLLNMTNEEIASIFDPEILANNNKILQSVECEINDFIKKYEQTNRFTDQEDITDKISNLKLYVDKLHSQMHKFGQFYLDYFSNEIQMHNKLESYVQTNCKTFHNLTYHYCPHYILCDEKDNEYDPSVFTTHVVEIDDGHSDNFGRSTCIISVSPNHILHPTNSNCNIDWIGMNWTISDPISKHTVYEEGILNAC